MNWDNNTVLKFLELYQVNSCIWDPQNESHKNRQRVNDAWNNIKENLGVPCTVPDLKKKKESLMSAYRSYKTKIKKSERSGSGANDIYQPTWFAFAFMDSFLGSIYECNKTRSTEDEEQIENTDTTDTIATDEQNESNPATSNQKVQEPTSMTPTPPVRRRQRNPPELVEAKQHMQQAFNFMKQVSQQQHHPNNADDECTIFGQLIARKIRKLSEERRDIMMVKINQLFVDEHMLNSPSSRPYNSPATYTSSPPMTFQEVYSPQSAPIEEFQHPQTAPIEECSTVGYPSFSRESKPNPIHGASADPLYIQTSSVPSPSTSHSARPCSTREFILSNTVYEGPADSLKDFIIFKPK